MCLIFVTNIFVPLASWTHLCTYIFEYVSQIPTSAQSQPLLMSRLEHLLARVRAQHLQEGYEDEKCSWPSFKHIPWDDILILCIDHRLKDWQLIESPVVAGKTLSSIHSNMI